TEDLLADRAEAHLQRARHGGPDELLGHLLSVDQDDRPRLEDARHRHDQRHRRDQRQPERRESEPPPAPPDCQRPLEPLPLPGPPPGGPGRPRGARAAGPRAPPPPTRRRAPPPRPAPPP